VTSLGLAGAESRLDLNTFSIGRGHWSAEISAHIISFRERPVADVTVRLVSSHDGTTGMATGCHSDIIDALGVKHLQQDGLV